MDASEIKDDLPERNYLTDVKWPLGSDSVIRARKRSTGASPSRMLGKS
jgi:hypothetical protein